MENFTESLSLIADEAREIAMRVCCPSDENNHKLNIHCLVGDPRPGIEPKLGSNQRPGRKCMEIVVRDAEGAQRSR